MAPDDPDDRSLPPTNEAKEPPPDDTAMDRARHTGVGAEDEAIVGDDEPHIIEDDDPDADPGAVV